MTYCVGMRLRDGLVMLSDTRTNAGVDYVSTFSKMHHFGVAGERMICVMTAGNLAITQSIINLLDEGMEDKETGEIATLHAAPTMFQAARLVGRAVRQVYELDGEALKEQGLRFDVSLLVGGQIAGRTLRLFNVYAAGNFIEATADTPFLQAVHMGAYDFTRFTPLGQRALFKRFTEIEVGISAGPMSALRWAIEHAVKSLVRGKAAAWLLRPFTLPLGWIEQFSPRNGYALDACSGSYFIGRKSNRTLTPQEIIAAYRGAQ